MIWRSSVFHLLFIFFCLLATQGAIAQPTLPAIDGSADKGNVFLTWNCQYDGVKDIEVFRSADSLHNYALIGYVKKLKKGVQTFLDPHPVPGRSFYKLNIIFKSGLNWNTNYIGINVDKVESATSAIPRPPIDSAKHSAAEKVKKTEPAATESGSFAKNEKKPVENKVGKTFLTDTANKSYRTDTAALPPLRRRVRISSDDPAARAPEIITSKYIFNDRTTGQILLELPEDIKEFHYSVKFYDSQNHSVVEVPKINAVKIILDKRNFQKKGTYKFILRKDGLEFERGYVTIN